jgi:type IV pilus assembly protein PilB
VRDGETAGIVTQAALTGHLVFSTLHTNDSVSAVTRLGNLGLEPYLIAATIRGVLAQRLVRKICPHCKDTWTPDERIAEALTRSGCQWDTLYRGTGCGRCRQTGFAGRIGIFELLVPDPIVLDAIATGATLQDLRTLVEGRGFRNLRQDGLEKVCNGLTTPEEVLSATSM